MKVCTKCKSEKPDTEFYSKLRRTKTRYLFSWCKQCWNDHQKNKHPSVLSTAQRRSHLKRVYGLTPEQYEELLVKQNGDCAICERHYTEFKTRLHIDHRHKGPRAGEITGLLCWSCNAKLIGDRYEPELFEKAAAYLRQGTGFMVPENMIKGRKRRRKRKKH